MMHDIGVGHWGPGHWLISGLVLVALVLFVAALIKYLLGGD